MYQRKHLVVTWKLVEPPTNILDGLLHILRVVAALEVCLHKAALPMRWAAVVLGRQYREVIGEWYRGG